VLRVLAANRVGLRNPATLAAGGVAALVEVVAAEVGLLAGSFRGVS